MTTNRFDHYPANADVIFREVIDRHENSVCFDCGRSCCNANFMDIYLGTFLCHDCAVFHNRHNASDLPLFISRVCPAIWYDDVPCMLIMMKVGGNERAWDFFHQHGGWTNEDLVAKYDSSTARLYSSELQKEVARVARALEKQNGMHAQDFSNQHGGGANGGDAVAKFNSSTAGLYMSEVMNDGAHAVSALEKGKQKVEELNYSVKTKKGKKKLVKKEIEAMENYARKIRERNYPSKKPSLHEFTETDEARRKFPNAKSISSANFFRDEVETDDTEAKHHLPKFMNATAISSADLFKEGSAKKAHLFNCAACEEQYMMRVSQEQWGLFEQIISCVTRIFG